MNKPPVGFWQRTWNEPRPFFLWLTFLSLAGIVLVIVLMSLVTVYKPHYELQTAAVIFAAGLILTGVLGIAGFILSLIPPVRGWLEGVLRRRFFALACVLTLIVLVVMEEDWRGWRAWNNFKTEWEAKGEKFDLSSLIPPAVPDGQNFGMSTVWIAQMHAGFANDTTKAPAWYGDRINAPDVTRWLPYLPLETTRTNDNRAPVHLGDWQRAEPTDLKAWQEYYRTPPANHAATEFAFPPQLQMPADDVLLALGKYDPVIAQLQKDSQRPAAQFPINYDTGSAWSILLPHLAWLKKSSMVLALRASAEVAKGDTASALNDEKLIWRFTDASQTEPFLISHLVRVAEIRIGMQPVWEGLAQHRWSDADLAELDQGFSRFDFLKDFELAARGERNVTLNAVEYLRRTGHWIEFRDPPSPALCLLPRAFYYQNEVTLGRLDQQWILASADPEKRIVSPSRVSQTEELALRELGLYYSPYRVLARSFVPGVSSAVKRFAEAQATVDLARVAIALERYRLAHGAFPDSLDVLAPQFLASVPHDVIDGQPLHYRRTSDGQFVLYSVGWNEKDDGGVVAYEKGSSHVVNWNLGDWVWKYPGKE